MLLVLQLISQGGVIKLESEVCGAPAIAVVFHGVRAKKMHSAVSEGTRKEGGVDIICLQEIFKCMEDSGVISDFNVFNFFSTGNASECFSGFSDNAQLHPGFARLLLNSYENMSSAISRICKQHELIEQSTQVIFTGHSLGGALAMLGALKYFLENKFDKESNLVKAVSFCAPNLGNSAFRDIFYKKFNEANTIRVYTKNDLIPRLPPFFLPLGREFRISRGEIGGFCMAVFTLLEEVKKKKICTGVNDFCDVMCGKQLATPEVLRRVEDGVKTMLDNVANTELIIGILANPGERGIMFKQICSFHKVFSLEEITARHNVLKAKHWDLLD